ALHLEEARRDPDYKFVLAEIDYLKPYFDACPQDRADLLDFIAAGRIELAGGSYNEPNTNLTSAESTIRNAVYGIAYQRDMLGGDPRTSWMLDAFGFDPGYPGLMAAAGMRQSSWARGPFHQWGPGRTAGDNALMQFAAEFEWISPDGAGLLTSYMANHYSAGWGTQQAGDLAGAELAAYQQFLELAPVAATRNVLLPVGGDHVVPSRWATAIHRDWNAWYAWPRFVTAVPGEFFAAVRAEAATRGDVWITPQTRDMNPVYTGKDVSYIDTKQAQRAAETALLDAERLATLAWLAGARYPAASLDRAWRLLVFGAHHDAITGTEGDQVYLDLLAGWREAWQRGSEARDTALDYLAGLADTAAGDSGTGSVIVFNTLAQPRDGMVTTALTLPGGAGSWIELADESGAGVPFLAEGVRRHGDGSLAELTVTFRVNGVPACGYASYQVRPSARAAEAGWRPAAGTVIASEAFEITADPELGGTLVSIVSRATGAQLLSGPGNELVLQEEYPQHPRWNEGPWLLCPAGPGTGSASRRARVRAERCPAGSRLVTELELGGLRVTQETLLWDGADRVEFRTHVDGSIGQDKLLRVAFPVHAPGGLPVYQTAISVIGRPPGPLNTDVARHEFTLDSPASEWFGVGSVARIALAGADGERETQAIGVAEVVTGDPGGAGRDAVRGLLAALARQGVTATCSRPDGPRYGYLAVDSNLPDFRITLGGPDDSAFTAEVLAAAQPGYAAELDRRMAAGGTARLWVPAGRSRAEAFADGADLRAASSLPVLIIAPEGGLAGLVAAIGEVVADLADGVIEVPAFAGAGEPGGAGGPGTALAGRGAALLNRGTPSALVTPDNIASMALMRACSSWPCGTWIDGPARTTPDGTSFAWQHWSHTFEYALAGGDADWRAAGFGRHGQDYGSPLLAVSTGAHGGPLPGRASLASVEPAGLVLSALKPRGNPLAPGAQPDPADGVTVRLRGGGGGPGPVPARFSLFTGIEAARESSLCEDADGDALPVNDGAAEVAVPVAGMATFAVTPARLGTGPDGAGPDGAGPDGGASPAEPPAYARYWLHGTGPAPAGNMPAAVHLSPARTHLSPGETGQLTLTVAAGAGPARGEAHITVPAGLSVSPAGSFRYDLPSRGVARWDITVTSEAGRTGRADGAGRASGSGRAGGHRFVTARITGPDGQETEDAVMVAARPGEGGAGERAAAAGGAAAGTAAGRGTGATAAGNTAARDPAAGVRAYTDLLAAGDAELAALEAELDVEVGTRSLRLLPGQDGVIEAVLTSRAGSPIRGEAQLLSPWGTWDAVRRWTVPVEVGAGESATLQFRVCVPAAARPGQAWWAIVKIMYFGRTCYSEPVSVVIG
ncbi:MAG TPA: glycoside hydrolase family 38 C-terminal domain-containing protein, partial [Streptosporangiaceae bacterium]